ncbi:MAG: hypothetical protein RR523_11860 [Cetobacterium sp.]|uniref:hypothetical protein n=1 Tax=Cetobacterium sp. TaxID=2071632 RepID=UPI002FCA9C4C
MFKIIVGFLFIVNLNFAKEIILYSWKYDEITGKVKIEKKKDYQNIYFDGIWIAQTTGDIDAEYEKYKTKILIDTISNNYSIIDVFAIDLNFDSNQEICLVLKKEDKNYIKIYYYSSEDDKFYEFLNDEQNQEIKKIFSTDKNFSIDKLKKYLNDKLPFVEVNTEGFLHNLKKEFDKNLLNENFKFLSTKSGEYLVYLDENKNYYTFSYSGTRNIYLLSSYFEGEVDKTYFPITGIAYYKNYRNLKFENGTIIKVEYKDKKILKESIMHSLEHNILQEIFYNSNTSKAEKEYIYRNNILSKKILYTYSENGKQKTVENYDDFKQIENWQKDKNGKLKERYKIEFNEVDISNNYLVFESDNTKIYLVFNPKNQRFYYALMERHWKEWEYFYLKEIFDGISGISLKNGISDIVKNGYSEKYMDSYPKTLNSLSTIAEKGYYKNNKKDGMWVFNYGGQLYSKVYYINGIPICYWEYDAYDHLTEFGIYINSKRIILKKKKYFYGPSR